MNDDMERKKARGIYLGGIGLFLMGIASIIWSVTSVIKTVSFTREIRRFGGTEVVTSGAWQGTSTPRTATVEDVVQFLNTANPPSNNSTLNLEQNKK